MKIPPLPRKVEAPGGPVTIVRKPAGLVRAQTGECWGTWEQHTRIVEIDTSAPPIHQWRTLFHELTHVALDDAGLSQGMHDDLVEAICEGMATFRMRERFG